MMSSRLFHSCRRKKTEACGPVALWVWRCLLGVVMTLTAVCGGLTPPWSVFSFFIFFADG